MARNILYPGPGVSLNLDVAALTASGDPVLIGTIPGVAQTDRDALGKATVKLPFMFVVELDVEAVVNAGDSAVVIGDQLYYDTAATIKINKDVTAGVAYGKALGAIDAGSHATILVGV